MTSELLCAHTFLFMETNLLVLLSCVWTPCLLGRESHFVCVIRWDAEHFPQQTVWFCSCVTKDLFGIKTSLPTSQWLRSSANNLLIKQKHLCKCHCLIDIYSIFYVIMGGWWPSQQFQGYIGRLYFWVMSPNSHTGQKAEPCFPIRARESLRCCCWCWQGLVHTKAALSVFHIHDPGSLP